MGISGGPYIVRDSSLVLELDAADKNSYPGSGTAWNNLTTSSPTVGTLTNTPTFNSANGGGIILNGTNQYISLNSNPLSGAAAATLDIFVKISTNTGAVTENPIISLGNTTGLANQMRTYVLRNGKLCVSYYNNDYIFNYTVTAGSIINATFLENGSGLVSLYVNGVFVDSSTITAPNTTGTSFNIGYYVAGAVYLNGTIYTTRLYNRVLSATEILQNYNEQKSRFGL